MDNKPSMVHTKVVGVRVLHGFAGSANQPYTLASVQRRAGIDAISVTFGDPAMGFSTDLVVNPQSATDVQRFFSEYASTFDIVHFHATSPFKFHNNISTSIAGALLALKASGVKIVYHFRGSDARVSSEFYKLNISNGEHASRLPLKPSWTDAKVRRNISFWNSVSDMTFAVDEEIQTYVPHSRLFPRAVPDLAPPDAAKRNTQLVVAHAPTNYDVKGSAAFSQALKSFSHPAIELRLLPKMSHQELIKQLVDVDIVVDQFRLGWFGVFAVEAMALSKPVMVYIRPDLRSAIPSAGIIDTTAKSFTKNLEEIAQLRDAGLARLGRANRQCWDRLHSPRAIQEVSHELYEEVLKERPRKVRYLDLAVLCQPEGLGDPQPPNSKRSTGPVNHARRWKKVVKNGASRWKKVVKNGASRWKKVVKNGASRWKKVVKQLQRFPIRSREIGLLPAISAGLRRAADQASRRNL